MTPLLFSSARLPYLLLGFLFLVVLTPIATTAQPLYQICPARGAKYTGNSTFQSNLNSLLSSLAVDGSGTGFVNVTAGDVPDRVYGLVLCRGDVSRGDCGSCLARAAGDIVQACPYKKSAVIWYDNCMLRYSYLQFFSADDNLEFYMWNTQNLTEVSQFNQQRDEMMAELVRYAAYNGSARMFATGQADYGADPANPKIYGLVQCTRDLSADGCHACLRGILNKVPSQLTRSKGGRILKATCNFRYELYSFYNNPVMVSIPLTNATPPLLPPTTTPDSQGKEKKSTTGTVLAIAIPVGVALAVITAVLCFCFCRRKSKVIKFYVRDTQEISGCESLLFDLSTLRDATVDFSDEHKLGQGGFGSVHKGVLPK